MTRSFLARNPSVLWFLLILSGFTLVVTLLAEGFGLGLHLVRQIIGLHDGEIAAVEAEAGACFRLTLPKRSDSEMEDVRGGEEKTGEESDGEG